MIVRTKWGQTFGVRKYAGPPEEEAAYRRARESILSVLVDIRGDARDTLVDRDSTPGDGWQAWLSEIAEKRRDDVLDAFDEAVEEGAQAGVRASQRRFDFAISFDEVPQSAIDELHDYTRNIVDDVLEVMGSRFEPRMESWLEEGLDYDEIADRMQDELDDVLGEIAARRHARTLTHGAAERGNREAIRESSAVGKEWVATMDSRVRATHADANEQTVPTGDEFDVGTTKLEHPGDPTGAVGEVVNCRCTTAPVFADDLGGDREAVNFIADSDLDDEEASRRIGSFIDDADTPMTTGDNFTEFDGQQARAIFEGFDDIRQRSAFGPLRDADIQPEVRAIEDPDGAIGQYAYGDEIMRFNSETFTDDGARDSISRGWLAGDPEAGARNIVHHEMGHAQHHAAMVNDLLSTQRAAKKAMQASFPGRTQEIAENQLSEYASTDPMEAVAELFNAKMSGQSVPRPLRSAVETDFVGPIYSNVLKAGSTPAQVTMTNKATTDLEEAFRAETEANRENLREFIEQLEGDS